jgi:hypothetical protein
MGQAASFKGFVHILGVTSAPCGGYISGSSIILDIIRGVDINKYK